MHAPMKPAITLSAILACGACIVALACGREVASPSAAQSPVATPLQPDPSATVAATTVATTVPAAAEVPAGEGCIEVDAELGGKHTTLEGRLFVDGTYQHPSRGKTRPFILRLDAPRCVIGRRSRASPRSTSRRAKEFF